MHKIINIISTVILSVIVNNNCHAFDLYKETDEGNITKPSSDTPSNTSYDNVNDDSLYKAKKKQRQDEIRALRNAEKKHRRESRQKYVTPTSKNDNKNPPHKENKNSKYNYKYKKT